MLFDRIFAQIEEFFNEVSYHIMGWLGEHPTLYLWEGILMKNYRVMRKLLQPLLQAMGFSSVEEAEEKNSSYNQQRHRKFSR